MGRERRHFADDFKTEAIALLASSGRPLVQIAGELGLSPSMLRNWRHRRAERNTGSTLRPVAGSATLLSRTRRRKSPGCAARTSGCAWSATF